MAFTSKRSVAGVLARNVAGAANRMIWPLPMEAVSSAQEISLFYWEMVMAPFKPPHPL